MLTLDSVCFQYGQRHALRAITASSDTHKVVALVGRNGSGKSTLLRLIAGLALPTSGSLRWRGTAPSSLAPARRALEVAYVAQRPALAIDLTAREMISLGRFASRSRLDGAVRIDRAIEQMGLEELRDRAFHELSAGEQQRCVVARALAQHETNGLLALDEPFSNLDPGEMVRVFSVIRQCAKEGALVVIALHDLSFVDQVADTVWWLEHGTALAMGAPSDVLTTARLKEIFQCDFVRGPQGLTIQTRL